MSWKLKRHPSLATVTRNSHIFKNMRKPKPVKRRDGLLNTKIAGSSHLMDIANRNSTESPLLRLPGEIRNLIWEYAVGGHQVNIHGRHRRYKFPDKAYVHSAPLESETNFVTPNFRLPQVCRQIYAESAHMVYTLNTFGFNNGHTMDRWIKKLPLGWKRVITSIDVPFSYMRLYRTGRRQSFQRKFPNIKRLGIDLMYPNYIRERGESYEHAKTRVLELIHDWDSKETRVDWHAGR